MRCIPLAELACLPLPPCISTVCVNLFGSQKCEGGINQIYYVAAIAGGGGEEARGFEALRAGFCCSSRCSKNGCGSKNEELLCSVHCFHPNCNAMFSINQCKVSKHFLIFVMC